MTSPVVLPQLPGRKRALDIGLYARVLSSLLTPVAAAGYAMSFWRFAADMRWMGEFFISEGLLSRWQVWLAMAIAVQTASHYLGRAANVDNVVTE